MSRHLVIIRLACAALALTTLAPARGGIVFTDDFEETTLNPFWSASASSGSIVFPSTAMAHSGNQSVQFSSTETGETKDLTLSHTFAAPIYGETSVWIYDTGAGAVSGNYVQLTIADSTNGDRGAYLNAWDYDLAPDNGGSYVFGITGRVNYQYTAIERTQTWHQFLIDSTPDSLMLSIDGVTVYTGAGGLPFDKVQLQTYGPSWRPAWSYYFDDFSVAQSVPEPSSLVSLGLGILTVFGYVWRRHRKLGGKQVGDGNLPLIFSPRALDSGT